MFSCPGTVVSGAVRRENVSHYDVFETVLDLCGVSFEKIPDMPGRSFAGLLTGMIPETENGDAVVFDEYGATRMICDGSIKLVRRFPAGPDELYDLDRDPGEYRNEIDNPDYAEQIAALDDKLVRWYRKYVDPEFDGTKEDVRGKGQLTSHSFIQ